MRAGALGLLALGATALAGAAPAGAADQLGHEGRWLTDTKGRVVILHGHNMVYKRPPYRPSTPGFGRDDARFLAREGYNTIRVGIILKALEPEPGEYDDEYLDDIERTVEVLGKEGIYSMLDFHQDMYNERFFGEGWPDWAVLGDAATLPNQPNFGFPANYFLMPATSRAFDHFWADDPGPGGVGLQERYAAAWRHVAKRFRGNRWVMGYDLMNEPWPGSTWQTCANPQGCPVFDAVLQEFNERTLKAIREVDRRTLVFYEPNVIFNDGADTNLTDTGDRRAGFSFHDYCLTQATTQGDPVRGCDVFDDLVFRNAEEHAAEVGDTLLLSEFGATDDLDTMREMVERADEFMVSWQHWHYCGCDDPTTSGSGDTQAIVLDPEEAPEGDNLKQDKLDVLSRPYPQRVAGTPTRFAFDADSREFTFEFTTHRASGRGRFGRGLVTKVFLPERQYPDGYDVEVRDAEVVSEPNSRMLRLLACSDAIRDIDVRVTPGDGEVESNC